MFRSWYLVGVCGALALGCSYEVGVSTLPLSLVPQSPTLNSEYAVGTEVEFVFRVTRNASSPDEGPHDASIWNAIGAGRWELKTEQVGGGTTSKSVCTGEESQPEVALNPVSGREEILARCLVAIGEGANEVSYELEDGVVESNKESIAVWGLDIDPPTVEIVAPAEGEHFYGGTRATAEAVVTYDGSLGDLSVEWEVDCLSPASGLSETLNDPS